MFPNFDIDISAHASAQFRQKVEVMFFFTESALALFFNKGSNSWAITLFFIKVRSEICIIIIINKVIKTKFIIF